MYKNAMKCNETLRKWCKNKHGALKIIDTIETYHGDVVVVLKVGEEEPDGAMKTMRGRQHPALREVARWKPAMS
jgi:hypothetical protein